MTKKPTYSELEQRFQELKTKFEESVEIAETLKKSQSYLQSIFDNINQPMFLKTSKHKYILTNNEYERIVNNSQPIAAGTDDYAIYPEHIASLLRSQDKEVMERCSGMVFRESIPFADGEHTFITSKFPLVDNTGKIYAVGGVCTDITQLEKEEAALKKAHDELENMVQDRTAELEKKSRRLEESNIALRVLMRQSESDKKNLEKDVLFNVEKLIRPTLERLHNNSHSIIQKNCLNVLETNLQEITAPFALGMADKLRILTPAEINVANLVKQGKTSKEIAELLNLAPTTISTFRRRIRKKIGLKGEKLNLTTFLSANQ